MADNTILNPGSGGDTIATDDISGVKHQQVKIEWGVDGTATPVSAANPMPIVQTGTPGLPTGAATAANQQTDALTDTQLRATPVPVSGTVTANIGTVNTLATAAKQDTGNTSLGTIDTSTAATSTTLGAKTDAKNTATDSTSVSAIGVLKQISASVQAPPSQAVTNAGTFLVQNNAATPAGTNNIGDVDVLTVNGVAPAFGTGARGATVQRVTIATDDSVPVTGTFFQATQPVSLATNTPTLQSGSTTAVTQATGTNLHTVIDSGTVSTITNVVHVDDNSGSLTVDGTVTANAGTNLNTSALALETGGNLASIKADADNLNLAQGSTTSGQKGNLGLGAVTTAAPTYTTAQSSPLSMDTSGNLRVAGTFSANPPSSVISTVNSTTSNLAGAAAFTGTGEDVSNYAALQVSVFSSHVSATDGLSLQQSSDNSNWDITDTYTIPATTGKVFSIQPASQYFRLVYTNGATLTTSLRIKVVYHYSAPNPSSQRASDAYTNETDLTEGWSFNSLYNGTTWDRMRGDITNGLDVDVTRLPTLANVTTVATVSALGTGTTGPMKAEDVAHATGDMGIPAWGVRNDNLGTTYGADQDYGPIATDLNGRVMVAQKAATATLANVAGSATSVTLIAANSARIGATITNDSSALLYIKFGTTASTTSYTIVLAGTASAPFSYYEVPAGFTGRIDGIWSAASGNARTTEIS